MPWLSLSMILTSVFLNALAQIFLRKAAAGFGEEGIQLGRLTQALGTLILDPFLLLGMLCYAFSILVWIAVLARVEVSVAYPFLSIGYIVVIFAGFFFLGENVTMLRVAGVALICAGLVCISRSA